MSVILRLVFFFCLWPVDYDDDYFLVVIVVGLVYTYYSFIVVVGFVFCCSSAGDNIVEMKTFDGL